MNANQKHAVATAEVVREAAARGYTLTDKQLEYYVGEYLGDWRIFSKREAGLFLQGRLDNVRIFGFRQCY